MSTEPPRQPAASPWRFSLRDIFWLTLVVAIFLWFQVGRPRTANRYQMEIYAAQGTVIMLDTATGIVWERDINGHWSAGAAPSDLKP